MKQTLEDVIYKNSGLRAYFKRILGNGHRECVDDLIQESVIIVLEKYDVNYLLEDGCLPFVVRETGRRLVMSERGRFRRMYFRRTFAGYVEPESGCLIQSLDRFFLEGNLTNFEKILLSAMDGEPSLLQIEKDSGVNRRTLHRHATILKNKYKKWLRSEPN